MPNDRNRGFMDCMIHQLGQLAGIVEKFKELTDPERTTETV